MGSLLAALRAGESAPRMTPVQGIEGIEGIEVVFSDDEKAGRSTNAMPYDQVVPAGPVYRSGG
jgi:hypothetical protein